MRQKIVFSLIILTSSLTITAMDISDELAKKIIAFGLNKKSPQNISVNINSDTSKRFPVFEESSLERSEFTYTIENAEVSVILEYAILPVLHILPCVHINGCLSIDNQKFSFAAKESF